VPVYEYQCESCERIIEKIQKFSDPPLTQCEECGGPLKKILSPPALVFKGSGFYITDYVQKKPEKEKAASGGDQPSTSKAKESSASPATTTSSNLSPHPQKKTDNQN
jgi:putative FmdB family regulatory protein